jgi:hypothetical protein
MRGRFSLFFFCYRVERIRPRLRGDGIHSKKKKGWKEFLTRVDEKRKGPG